MKNKYCIYSTIFPKSKKFFFDFIKSVNNQTIKNFDLILCLNGTTLNKKLLKQINVPYKLIYCDLPMNEARVYALKKLINQYEIITLLDSDDYMDFNRCELVYKNFRNYDFLVNNLYTFSKNKPKPKKWLKIKRKIIKLNDIHSSNFIGLSNLSVKTKILKKIVKQINFNLLALDWCIAKLLLFKKAKAIFIPTIITYYRQYNDNVSNLDNFDKKQIIKDLKSKIDHYKYFKKFRIHKDSEITKLEAKLKKIEKLKKNNLKNFLTKTKKTWWSHI